MDYFKLLEKSDEKLEETNPTKNFEPVEKEEKAIEEILIEEKQAL